MNDAHNDKTLTPDLGLDRDAEDLHRALTDLVQVYQFRDRKRICCHDISVTQCYALKALMRRGPLTLGDLASELYLDKSTMSRVVDSLEKKGYTERVTDPSDRRCVQLEPTPDGLRLMQRIERDLVAENRLLLEDFEPEVRQATTRLVARLAQEAAARFSRVDGSCCTSSDSDPD